MLATPRQVRNAIAYVLCNARKHGHAPNARGWTDRCSSASAFDGWVTSIAAPISTPIATAQPRTWLLRVGWRRGGLLHPDHRPGAMPS